MAAPPEEVLEPQNLEEPLMHLTNLGRTIDGQGLAYRKMECVGKRIGIIKVIEPYQHLNYIDLSQNMIKDIAPLKGLKNVLTLKLAQNEIPDLKKWEGLPEDEELFPNLQELDLSTNAFTAMPQLAPMKALRSVSLKQNEIASCAEFTGHETLTQLDLSENKLTNLVGLASMAVLNSLNVASNEITEIGAEKALTELPELKHLNLAGNVLESLTGAPWQDMPNLQSLNVSNGGLQSADNLEVLRQLPKLRSLEVAGNPFLEAEAGGTRTQVLVAHWRLTEIDGVAVTPAELEEAKELNLAQLLEREARLKAEAEEGGAAGEDA